MKKHDLIELHLESCLFQKGNKKREKLEPELKKETNSLLRQSSSTIHTSFSSRAFHVRLSSHRNQNAHTFLAASIYSFHHKNPSLSKSNFSKSASITPSIRRFQESRMRESDENEVKVIQTIN